MILFPHPAMAFVLSNQLMNRKFVLLYNINQF